MRGTLIVGLICLTVAIAFDVWIYLDTWVAPHPVAIAFSMALGGFLTISYLMRRRFPETASALRIIGIFGGGFAAFGFVAYVSFFLFPYRENLNPKYYSRAVETYRVRAAELVRHFPNALPANADRLRFCHLPEGGGIPQQSHIQARYAAPRAFILAELARLRPNAVGQKPGGGGLSFVKFRNATNTGYADLPGDFEVIILVNRVFQAGDGYAGGFATSETAGEVIYWATIWP